jgi:hypothetical protein
VLHLGPRTRVALAASWIAGQGALVLTAPMRFDAAFGFRMFPEASTIEIHLTREVHGLTLPVPRGEWSAQDGVGRLKNFFWHDRVRDGVLGAVDERVFASYGADAQLARLQRALDDVADHISGDADTERLGAKVSVWKNGREEKVVRLFSHQRRVQ